MSERALDHPQGPHLDDAALREAGRRRAPAHRRGAARPRARSSTGCGCTWTSTGRWSKAELAAFRALIERRIAGEPTQYLTGVREFYGRRFKVDARVLIPRPETELLVEAALQQLPKDAPGRVLDLCTGSGCIAISLAAERPQASVLATDLSPDACALARENAEALGVARPGDGAARATSSRPLPPRRRFDVVVSNPPYIADRRRSPTLSAEVRREPQLALDGGPTGSTLIRRIVAGARRGPRAWRAACTGDRRDQGAAGPGAPRGRRATRDARVEKDLARRDRLAFGTQPAAAEPQRLRRNRWTRSS